MNDIDFEKKLSDKHLIRIIDTYQPPEGWKPCPFENDDELRFLEREKRQVKFKLSGIFRKRYACSGHTKPSTA